MIGDHHSPEAYMRARSSVSGLPAAKCLAGIDIGTTGAKAIVFDFEGNPLGTSYNEYGCTYPRPNWVEQDAVLVVEATMRSAREAIAKSRMRPGDILSVSVSAQRCCGIFLDGEEKMLRPMISWQDNRTPAEVEEIGRTVDPGRYYEKTGFPNSTTWLLSKMMWVRKNEPEVWSRTKRVVQMHDYFLRALGVEDYYVDLNDAGFFGLFDTIRFRWDGELLRLFGIDPGVLPIPAASGTVVGRVSRAGSENSGFAEGTPIAVGAGDQCAGSLGAGVVKRGLVSISMGTAGAVTAFLPDPFRDPKGKTMITNHSIKGKWLMEGYQAAAAGVYRWFRDEIAALEKADAGAAGKDPYELIEEIARQAPAGSRGLLLLPYFASAATPRYNSSARGVLVGLTFAHDRGCLARAFMEGITLDMFDMIQAAMKAGVSVEAIRLLGGPTRSRLWNQIQADVYGMPVQTLKITDATVLGAAILGGVGAGVFQSIEEGSNRLVQVETTYEPDPEATKRYAELYDAYCRVYDALDSSGSFKAIAALQL
jgi:xylulokinase